LHCPHRPSTERSEEKKGHITYKVKEFKQKGRMTTMKGKEEPEATSIPSAGLPSYASSAQLYCAICTNEIMPAPGVVPGVVAEEKKQQLGEEGEVLPRMSRSTMRECCGRAVCGDCVDV
jgi:hypothetical protein